MSKADLFASGDRKWENNEQIKAAVEDVVAVHKRGIEGIRYELELGLVDDGNEIREMQADDRTGREGRLANARSHRYEVLDDGSVIEIILEGDTDSADGVQLVARPNLISDPRGFVAGGPDPTVPAEAEAPADNDK